MKNEKNVIDMKTKKETMMKDISDISSWENEDFYTKDGGFLTISDFIATFEEHEQERFNVLAYHKKGATPLDIEKSILTNAIMTVGFYDEDWDGLAHELVKLSSCFYWMEKYRKEDADNIKEFCFRQSAKWYFQPDQRCEVVKEFCDKDPRIASDVMSYKDWSEKNVIELKTKKENIMKTENVENENKTTLSKLTEEQLRNLKQFLRWFEVVGFYPTLNLELLTKCKERFDVEKKQYSVDLTGDEFVSIIKEYGCVSHSLSVSGSVDIYASFEGERYDITAEKIEEHGVDEIQSGDFEDIAEIVGVDSREEAERFVEENLYVENDAELNDVEVITTVRIDLP